MKIGLHPLHDPGRVDVLAFTEMDSTYLTTLTPWEAATLARSMLVAAFRAAGQAWKPCQYCPAPMVIARMDHTNKPIPLDPGDNPAGNLAIRWDDGQLRARGIKAGQRLEPGERPAISHFVTCPGADKARKPRSPAAR